MNITAGTTHITTAITQPSGKSAHILGPACTTHSITDGGLTLTLPTQSGDCPTYIIQDTAGASIFVGSSAQADFLEIGNFQLATTGAGSGSGMINAGPNSANGVPLVKFRAHHLYMIGDPLDGVSAGSRFIFPAAVYGVADHVYMKCATSLCGSNYGMQRDNNVSTSYTYHGAQNPGGSTSALYLESSVCDYPPTFQGNNCTDNYAGTQYVARFNIIFNNSTSSHGFDSQPRGARWFEIYGNSYHAKSGANTLAGAHIIRSGSGIMFNNTITNDAGVSNGYTNNPLVMWLYPGMSTAELVANGNLWIRGRATLFYPATPWSSFSGTVNNINTSDGNNFVTGSNPIDSNNGTPADSFDTSRTVNDMVTNGTTTITSATANFVNNNSVTGDLYKGVVAQGFVRGRVVTTCVFTSGTAQVTNCTGSNFTTAGDVGREISTDNRSTISGFCHILTVQSAANMTMDCNAANSLAPNLLLADPYIKSITNSTTAIMNVPATTSASGNSLTIGWLNQGYPTVDQEGFGSFATANNGNWPTVTTGYSAANFEKLDPIYSWNNSLNGSTALSTGLQFTSTVGYLKHLREYYDNADITQDVFANIPATCTIGAGYWATDKGGNWNHPAGGANNGALYRCTATNTWTSYYIPYTYPWCDANVGTLGCTLSGGSTPQTITFGAIANKTLGTPPFTVSATASSGLTVSFSSKTLSTCTLVDNGNGTATITLVAVGTCTIAANQAGNATFAAAPEVDQSFSIFAAGNFLNRSAGSNHPAGTTFPILLQLVDKNAQPLSNTSATVAVTRGAGMITGGAGTTDANGMITATVVLDTNPGLNTFTVTAGGLVYVLNVVGF